MRPGVGQRRDSLDWGPLDAEKGEHLQKGGSWQVGRVFLEDPDF